MMFNNLVFEVKTWWNGDPYPNDEINEFERIESKHTRVHHDEDIYEMIRVH